MFHLESMLWAAFLTVFTLTVAGDAPVPAERPVADAPADTADVAAPADAADAAGAADAADPVSPELRERILKIAAEYSKWGMVDDLARIAPTLCHVPPVPGRLSRADERSPHGRKMYYLFARHREAYLALGRPEGTRHVPSPVSGRVLEPAQDPASPSGGQVIVKESWITKETDATSPGAGVPDTNSLRANSPLVGPGSRSWTVRDGDRTLAATGRGPLFIMLQDEDERNTDEGWVYATVSPDAKVVTSAGRIESCMVCHRKASHGRLFGLDRKVPGAENR
ncbi:MAG: hypothetical protein DHS20C21_21580 [Gemmatimonadota bacterium]|nr:MAG: hypothetical protein DHS20C21_21580 [Gemmatimonadota bacterium]